MGAAATQDDGFRHAARTRHTLFQITEFRVVAVHVIKHGFRFIELALTLEIQREVVENFHHAIVHRQFAEFVEGHVKLPLPLKRKAQHAIGFRIFDVRFFLAFLGDNKALGHQRRVSDEQ